MEQVPPQLKKYAWKKGQSGNLKGRPPEKTLKEYTRAYLANMTDDERLEYLKTLDTDLIWKMAEGNPANNTDITSGGKPIQQITGMIIQKEDDNNISDKK